MSPVETVRQLLRGDRRLVTMAKERTVFEAALRMQQAAVSSLIVLEGGAPVGICTERDIVQRVVCPLLNPVDLTLAEIMSSPVISVPIDATIAQCRRMMNEYRVRHLPVEQHGVLVAMVSSHDIGSAETTVREAKIRELEAYIYSYR